MSSSFWRNRQRQKSKMFVPPKANSETELKPAEKSTHKWEYGAGIMDKDRIKIATWNVNGIRAVLCRRVLETYMNENDIDILCINETKIDMAAFEKNPIKIYGYNSYWNFCKISSGYSGVAVFSKILASSMEEDFPKMEQSLEGRVITLEFDKFYLVALYSPNSGIDFSRLNYRMQFDAALRDHVGKLQQKKHVIIAGDLNVVRDQIDIYKGEGKTEMSASQPSCSQQERTSFQKLLSAGYIDTFRELYPEKVQYTWWNMKIEARKRNIGWRIDYILISEGLQICLADALIQDKVVGSDHCPVEVHLDLSLIKHSEGTDDLLEKESVEDCSNVKVNAGIFELKEIMDPKEQFKQFIPDLQDKEENGLSSKKDLNKLSELSPQETSKPLLAIKHGHTELQSEPLSQPKEKQRDLQHAQTCGNLSQSQLNECKPARKPVKFQSLHEQMTKKK